VILDPNNPIEGLTDSKALSEKKRLALYPQIKEKALAWAVGRCSPSEIDELNILQATMVAMQRAIAGLNVQPDLALIDGNKTPQLTMDSIAVVKGDLRVDEISAASILAKVVRDDEMFELDNRHPQFGFAKHKGYPTKAHFEAIAKYGVIEEHRKSFKPVKRVLGIE
jgi:ribonuclease HII